MVFVDHRNQRKGFLPHMSIGDVFHLTLLQIVE